MRAAYLHTPKTAHDAEAGCTFSPASKRSNSVLGQIVEILLPSRLGARRIVRNCLRARAFPLFALD